MNIERRRIFLGLCLSCFILGAWSAKPQKWLKKARQAQVTVMVFDAQNVPRESQGVMIGDSGVVITEYDVLRGGVNATVIDAEGETHEVLRILGANSMYNVCKLQTARPGKSKGLSVAPSPAALQTEVYILPTSKADKNVPCTTDTICKDETFKESYHYYTLSASVPQRLAGCAVMNAEGEVVGLLQMAVQEGKPSYVIDASYAMGLTISAIDAGNDDLQAVRIPKALPSKAADAATYIYLSGTRDSVRYSQLTNDFIAAFPDSVTGYVMQAEWLVERGDYAQAQQVYDRALSQVKSRPEEIHFSLSKMIYALCISGKAPAEWDMERALAEAVRADSLNPVPIYSKQKADCLYVLKRYEEAHQLYLGLTQTNLRAPELFLYAAQCKQMQEGDHLADIIALQDSALNIYTQPYPKEAAPILLMRAGNLAKAGKKREAVADYNTYEHLCGTELSAEFYYTREQLEIACRMYPAALNDIERAIKASPDDAVLRAELAALNYRVDQVDDAIQAAREAIRIDPTLADAYRILGVCLRHQGKTAEGNQQLKKAVELGDTIAQGILDKDK